jgi:hypothetical protein
MCSWSRLIWLTVAVGRCQDMRIICLKGCVGHLLA